MCVLRQLASIIDNYFFETKIRSATLATKIIKNQGLILFFCSNEMQQAAFGEQNTKTPAYGFSS